MEKHNHKTKKKYYLSVILKLFQSVNANQPGNVVLSPYSITSLLALLQQGALGKTQEQITNALQMTAATSAPSYAQVTGDYKVRT